jgi:hypothetical protein
MFTRKICVTFCVAVAFWLAATWYYAWYCDVTGRTHPAKIGLKNAILVALLGLYAFIGGPMWHGGRHPFGIRLRRNDSPRSRQTGLGVLAAAAACGLLSLPFLFEWR